jgi:hypothetical protein
MALTKTAERAIAAYGGADLWRRAVAIEALLSARGLVFRLKWQKPFQRAKARFEIAGPRTRIQPIDSEGNIGVLDGHDVAIESKDGAVLENRPAARRYFPNGRRLLWWDRLDQTYFACYALWNYSTLPALLLRDDIVWTEECDGVLQARFPAHLPTHSERQRFRFDCATGLLIQHDYVAEVLGSWAKASMTVLEHRRWNGIPYVSLRRGTPAGPRGQARKRPVMVEIEVHEWRLVLGGQ